MARSSPIPYCLGEGFCSRIYPLPARLNRDLHRILGLLRDGPKTVHKLQSALGRKASRVSSLLMTRRRQGDICSLCCVTGPKGNPVNLWELRTPSDRREEDAPVLHTTSPELP